MRRLVDDMLLALVIARCTSVAALAASSTSSPALVALCLSVVAPSAVPISTALAALSAVDPSAVPISAAQSSAGRKPVWDSHYETGSSSRL